MIDGCAAPLGARAFDVLVALIERRNRVVDKNELLDLVWPGVVVEENNLQVQVATLRKLLGRRTISTIPGRGYQFTVDLQDDIVETGHVASAPDLRVPALGQAVSSSKGYRPQAERRQVTVLYLHLSQEASRQTLIDPEDLREVIAAYHHCVNDTVGRCGGHIVQLFGEGILVYFGYPVAREDDPERAVRAGLEVIAQVAALELGPGGRQARAAVATGLVVVADLTASAGPAEREIVGQAPDLAVRLLELAEPGTIIVADGTRRLVGGLFEFADLGAVSLKGVLAPVRAWKAMGPGSAEGRFEAFHAVRLTSLVGREEETELLLRRWVTAAGGEGQVVLLSGEAGIGKSRLAVALMERLADVPHASGRFFCSPQHSASALHPFIAQMERAAGIRHGDPVEARSRKLSALLAQAPASAQDMRLFASMLSLPGNGGDGAPVESPEQRRQLTLEAIVSRAEAFAARGPLLIVFEDAHWCDPTSLEALNLIVDRIRRLRALLIVTFRPEFSAPWIGESHVTALSLHRLNARQIGALIDCIEDGRHLPERVRRNIVERTDGIPLFVEEMTKALLEVRCEEQQRLVTGATATATPEVPATLQASLLARLDRLGTARDIAQMGAALGREFSHSLLAAVAQMPDADLDAALESLARSGLVFKRGMPPYQTYLFKHALVQDTAYGTLLREPRRALHARIAGVLESRFPDLVESEPELLARHSAEAGQIEKAAVFWGKAGLQSVARSALAEAMEQLTSAIEQVQRLPDTEAQRRDHIRFEVARLNALFHLKGYAAPETKAAAERARLLIETSGALGDAPGDPRLYMSVLYANWVANLVAYNSAACLDLATRFLALANEQTATGPRIVGHQIRGIAVQSLGRFGEAKEHYEQALSLYEPAEHRCLALHFGQDMRVVVLARRSQLLWILGYPDAALENVEQALSEARRIGQAVTLMYALSHVAFTLCQCGRFECAEEISKEGTALAEEKNARFWNAYGILNLGCIHALAGRAPEAIASISAGLEIRKATGATMNNSYYLSYLALAQAGVGEFELAKISIDRAIEFLEKSREQWYEAEARRAAGEIALLMPVPDRSAAEAHFTRAIEVARAQQARSWELRAASSLAKLWIGEGRRAEARDLLAGVYGGFAEGKDTLDLKRAGALIDRLPLKGGC
jgi:class 3 adenylate cyclase/predicted ATPase